MQPSSIFSLIFTFFFINLTTAKTELDIHAPSINVGMEKVDPVAYGAGTGIQGPLVPYSYPSPHPPGASVQRNKRNDLALANCPKGSFKCLSDGSLCVPQYAICNGKPDCPSGSDEDECENVHDKKFWDTFFVKRPGADVGRNDSCEYSTLSLGEEGCHCSGEKLFCQNNRKLNLSRIPQDVKFLDLTGSGADRRNFMDEGSRFHKLHTLILSSTNQMEIPTSTFTQLTSLEILHLTGNAIETILPKSFVHNEHLRKLFIGYNKISIIFQDSFDGLNNLEELDLRHNKLKSENAMSPSYFNGLKNLKTLHLSYNNLNFLPSAYFFGLEKLEILSLTMNKISRISDSFQNLTSLTHLYLSHNRLEILEDGMFCSLHSLLNLNLNNNGIRMMSSGAFRCLDSLQSLLLEQNKFGELDNPLEIFENLTQLQYIYFDHFWMCSWAIHVRSCAPKSDGISSIENLLDNSLLRVCVWIMGVVGVVGNGFVILSRLIVREKNRVHSFYIKNLALADLLMGLFLLSIGAHDVAFRGTFLAKQHAWRHSLTCQLSGLLSTLSSESSVLILALITLDRYLSIVKPFIERRNALLPAILIVGALWSTAFLLSAAPLSPFFLGYFGTSFYTSNGLCLPLNIHNPFDPGWEYSFFLFVVLNSVAFSFICFAYWRMLGLIRESTTSIRSTAQKQDGLLTLRFGLVVATDFLCWAPVIAAKSLAMGGVEIQADFYAWLAVFVLPVNSALNPIIYTLTTKLFKQQVSHLTVGFRKRLGFATEDSATSSLFYRNRISRTLNTSLNNSTVYSTTTAAATATAKRIGGISSGAHQRARNRVTVSAINSVIASSTGIQLPDSISSQDRDQGREVGGREVSGGPPLPLIFGGKAEAMDGAKVQDTTFSVELNDPPRY